MLNFRRKLKRLIGAGALVLAMTMSGTAAESELTEEAATAPMCTVYNGTNVGKQDYTRYADTVKSALVSTENGIYMRFQADAQTKDGSYLVQYFDSSFTYIGERLIPAELPLYGAFYDDGANYYIWLCLIIQLIFLNE